MSLLIFAVIVLVIVALALWAVRSIPMQAPGLTIITVAICLIAILVICERAGLLRG